jgi:hypothetical protein
VVAEAQHTDDGHQVVTRISATPLGDESLTLAADGVLTGWSVGASADEYSWDQSGDEPVMVVAAGTVRELSLLVNPAYGSQSQVTHVAANAPTPNTTPNGDTEMEAATITTPAEAQPLQAAEAPAVIQAPAVIAVREPAPVSLTAGEYIVEMILAQRGDRDAAQRIAAAAPTPIDTTTNVGVVPPSYVAGIIGNLSPYRPAWSSFQHAPLPATGDSLTRAKWDTLPVVAKYATQGGQPATNAVSIDPVSIGKDAWAHAVSASIALINRSDPGFAESYFAAAINSYYGALDADITADMVTAAGVTATAAATARGAISSAVKQAVGKQTDGRGVFQGQWPSWAQVGMDVWSALVDTSTMDAPGLSGGSMTLDAPQGSLSGLVVRANPALADDQVIVGNPLAGTVYEQAVMELRALVINTMSWELGIYTDSAFHVAYDKALGHGTFTPAGGGTTRSSK